MATLQSDVAVNYANQVMGLVAQIRNVRAQAAEIVAINANTPLGNLWNVLHTTALATDGTLGTADSGAPVPANPIDTRVYAALNRAVKLADLNAALQIIVDENAFCNGTLVAANAARPAQINAVSM